MLRISVAAATFVWCTSLMANDNAGLTAADPLRTADVPIVVTSRDGCQIKVIASNAKGTDIGIESPTSVNRGGTPSNFSWGAMNTGSWVKAQHNQTDLEFAAASNSSCASESRFRIVLKRGEETRTVFFPSATEYTSSKTINLGNVARHF